jgi:hypothetical protein
MFNTGYAFMVTLWLHSYGAAASVVECILSGGLGSVSGVFGLHVRNVGHLTFAYDNASHLFWVFLQLRFRTSCHNRFMIRLRLRLR